MIMRLTAKYRIYWDSDLHLLCDPATIYNPGSTTSADLSASNISGFFESDNLASIQAKISELNLILEDV